ncbi:MAG: 50S ribosomal protein L25 [Patescibacteria group bacterium]|nr:50S ribosomal protein L25 [Patescibacteria group bacterium]
MTSQALQLTASLRELTKKKSGQLREAGKIPAVLYGHKLESKNLTLDYIAFEKVLKGAGESTLVDLAVDTTAPVKVLIQDYQQDPRSGKILHVDFYQVRMDEKLTTEITLKFINEAPAVKELSGNLFTNMHHLEVECLPQYLVHEIEVDLSVLKTFDDVIHVKDIKLPEGLEVLSVPTDVVVMVQEQRSEQELADLEAKPEEQLPADVTESVGGEAGQAETKEKK